MLTSLINYDADEYDDYHVLHGVPVVLGRASPSAGIHQEHPMDTGGVLGVMVMVMVMVKIGKPERQISRQYWLQRHHRKRAPWD